MKLIAIFVILGSLLFVAPSYAATLNDLTGTLQEFAMAARAIPYSYLDKNPSAQEEFSAIMDAAHKAFDHGLGVYIDGQDIPDGIPYFLQSLAKQLRAMLQKSKGTKV